MKIIKKKVVKPTTDECPEEDSWATVVETNWHYNTGTEDSGTRHGGTVVVITGMGIGTIGVGIGVTITILKLQSIDSDPSGLDPRHVWVYPVPRPWTPKTWKTSFEGARRWASSLPVPRRIDGGHPRNAGQEVMRDSGLPSSHDLISEYFFSCTFQAMVLNINWYYFTHIYEFIIVQDIHT